MISRRPKKISLVARSLLILTNLAFLAAGLLLVVFAVGLTGSQWLDVFTEGTPFTKTQILAFFVGLGCLVVAVSLVGCWGACCRDRGLLCCYNLFVVLALVLAVLATSGSFMSLMKAMDWGGRSYPADPKEIIVAEHFNEIYCHAEAAYLCLDAPLDGLVEIMIPGIPHEISSLVEGKRGINSLCKDVENFLSMFGGTGKAGTEYVHLHTLCTECERVEKLETLRPVFEWVEKNCPMASAGTEVAVWCSDILVGGITGDEYAGAPYGACRSSTLNLWSRASFKMGLGFVGFLLFLLLIVVSVSNITRQGHTSKDDWYSASEDDPLLSRNARIY